MYGKTYLKYFTEDEYVEDTITLDGNDWTFTQHIKINTIPSEEEFKNVVKEYLGWKVSAVLRGDIDG